MFVGSAMNFAPCFTSAICFLKAPHHDLSMESLPRFLFEEKGLFKMLCYSRKRKALATLIPTSKSARAGPAAKSLNHFFPQTWFYPGDEMCAWTGRCENASHAPSHFEKRWICLCFCKMRLKFQNHRSWMSNQWTLRLNR